MSLRLSLSLPLSFSLYYAADMLIHSNAKTATRWGVTLLAHPHLDPSGIQLMPVGHILPGHPTPFGLPFFLWFSTPAGTRVPTSALHRHTSLLRDLSPP